MHRHHVRGFASRLVWVGRQTLRVRVSLGCGMEVDKRTARSRLRAGHNRHRNFGVINGTQTAMRQMQIGLKYWFQI
jgi:hypothetical protein